MDRVSQALIQDIPHGVRDTLRGRAEHFGVRRSTLHDRKHGRSSKKKEAQVEQYLTPGEEKAVVSFILQMAEFGLDVRVKQIPFLAFNLARQRTTNIRPNPPGRNWPQGFHKRNPDVVARRKQALDWKRYNIYEKTEHWFEVISKVLQRRDVDPDNVYNMDETGVMLSMPGSVKVLVGKNDLRVHRGGRVKRTIVTAIECVSASGRYLKPMIVWPASTHRANWTTFPTPGWHYAYSESGYTDSEISFEWLKRVFDPQTRERANGKPRVLVCDGFATHESVEVLEFVMQNNIILCRLPSHTSHKLQPCDVAVFGPLKAAYRDQVDRLERGGVGTIGKQHFTYLYGPAREKAFSEKNILAGWRASGLYPFNPDKVLTEIPRPVAEPTVTVTVIKTTEIDLCPEDEIVQTPTSSTGLASLYNQIERDAYANDEASKQRMLRHVQKFANAAEISFAERAIQRDQIQFLREVNDEGKVRQATKSIVLGKAKVMSYEDLEEARAKRAAKDAVKAKGKGTRGRKRKTSPTGDDTPNPLAKAARKSETSESSRASAAIVEQTQIAPVARMI